MKTTEIVNLIKDHLVEDRSYRVNSSDNPLDISTTEVRLALYIRKITSAYFKTLPDVSRIQLHDSESIKSHKNSKVHVLVIGYCPKTEAVIVWPPESITLRFNKRNNVSLYSRFSFQSKVSKSTKIESYKLSNGDVIIGSHVSAIGNVIAFVVPSVRIDKTFETSTLLKPQKTFIVTEMSDSDALKKIFEDHPNFTFADAVEYLRSNRKAF